jgi:hypothetical protein
VESIGCPVEKPGVSLFSIFPSVTGVAATSEAALAANVAKVENFIVVEGIQTSLDIFVTRRARSSYMNISFRPVAQARLHAVLPCGKQETGIAIYRSHPVPNVAIEANIASSLGAVAISSIPHSVLRKR